jgi:hypothetical protein
MRTRSTFTICAAVLMAACAFATPRQWFMAVPMGTNTESTITFGGDAGVIGEVDTIYITATDNASGATVTVYRVSSDTNVVDEVMATGTVTATKTFRPRVDATGTDGNDLTSDPPVPFLLAAEQVKVKVESAPTGTTWRVTIKTK